MKILVIRFGAAGDIVLTSLFVRALRSRFPGELHYMTKRAFAPLVRNSPHVDRVIELPDGAGLRELAGIRRQALEDAGGRYDILFDLHNSLRSRIVRRGMARSTATFIKPTFAKWLLVHRKINRLRPIVPIPERYLAVGKPWGLRNDGLGLELFTGATVAPIGPSAGRPTIGIAPGARHATKRWPAEKFGELGARFASKHAARVVLLGGPEERELCEAIAGSIGPEVINLAGRTDYLEAAAAIDLCDVVVSNDSALAHIAAARRRPVVTLFGSTVQEFGFAPYGERVRVVEAENLACRPCTTIGRAACPLGHFECMTTITVDDVTAAIESLR